MSKNKRCSHKIAGGYKHALSNLLKKHAQYSRDGQKVVSFATQTSRKEHIFKAFKDLRELGYKIQSPKNLQGKHINALAKHYEKKIHEGALSISTIMTRFSCLRLVGKWIEQPNLVKTFNHYTNGNYHRTLTATTSKAWSDAGIAVKEKIEIIRNQNSRIGDALALQEAFGLRSKESLLIKPHISDKGSTLSVTHGTKGGRDRFIPIKTQEQRILLDRIKQYVKPGESLIPKGKSYANFRRHYYRILNKHGISRKNGITAHGLRHEHLNKLYKETTGALSKIQGGNLHKTNPDLDRLGRYIVAEHAGHSREEIAGSYLGAKK